MLLPPRRVHFLFNSKLSAMSDDDGSCSSDSSDDRHEALMVSHTMCSTARPTPSLPLQSISA